MPNSKTPSLKPDFSKIRGSIIIDVCENCTTLRVQSIDGKPSLNYHEIIGALEVSRLNFVMSQVETNRTEARKELKSKRHKKR